MVIEKKRAMRGARGARERERGGESILLSMFSVRIRAGGADERRAGGHVLGRPEGARRVREAAGLQVRREGRRGQEL